MLWMDVGGWLPWSVHEALLELLDHDVDLVLALDQPLQRAIDSLPHKGDGVFEYLFLLFI